MMFGVWCPFFVYYMSFDCFVCRFLFLLRYSLFVGVHRSLFLVCGGCVVFVVCCALFDVCCLLYFCCLMFVVCRSLCDVCCLLFVVRCLLSVVRCALSVVRCLCCCMFLAFVVCRFSLDV